MGCEDNFSIIKNTNNQLSKGNIEGREVALRVLECALKKVNTYDLVKKVIKINQEKLLVREFAYDLSKLRDIYVLGGGKSSYGIASALEEIARAHNFDAFFSI